jgi:hypothetical protein
MRAGLTIGGIEVEVRAPRGPIESILADRYAPFLGAVINPVCSLRFEANGKTVGEITPPMAEVDDPVARHVTITHIDFAAEVDVEGDGVVRTASDPYTVDHFFRVLFGILAPRHDAVMVHACGAITNSQAHVFAGQSGAGKSTLASLAGYRPLLSDEHVLLRRIDGTWVAASTPFWGSYAKPGPARQAPLGALWTLRHWPTNEVYPLDAAACLRIAIENAVLPNSDPSIKHAVFNVAAELAQSVPAAELRFVPEATIWEEIDDRVAA